MRSWLVVALLPALVLAPGCFASHGRDGRGDAGGVSPDASAIAHDAGAAIDACGETASEVTELVCPRIVGPGDAIAVTVTNTPSGCCAEVGSRAALRVRGPRSLEIETWWDACACCELCECVGAPVSERVELGAFDVGWVSVVAGEHRCEIEVRESDCHSIEAGEVHAPLAVARGEEIPVLMRHHAGRGCGCRPEGRVWRGRKGEVAVGIDVCDCSSSDPCVDPGYEATALIPARAEAGAVSFGTGGGRELEVAVVDEASCREGPEVRGLRLVAPERESLIVEDPIGYWVVLELEDWYCCSMPLSRVERADSTWGSEVGLVPLSCAPSEVDCDCEPVAPTRWEHRHFLGHLAPGRYSVRAGAHRVDFDAAP
jgi:hypothetical protein